MIAPLCSAQDGNTPPLDIRELHFSSIPGAGTFSQPEFLKFENGDYISVAKYGIAYPAVIDWDNDGLMDLLVGEFGGGKNANLMVYRNIGTASQPKYEEGFYATDTKGEKLYIFGS